MAFRAPDPDRRPGWVPALEILGAGLAAADPATAVRQALELNAGRLRVGQSMLDLSLIERVYLVAAGKAAPAMTRAAEDVLGEHLVGGVAVTVPGVAGHTRHTTVHEGGHPLPNPGSLLAARHVARMLAQTTERDLVLALISGGASALLELPAGRVPLADLQAATASLLASGAAIHELNAVRKHLSVVKGGGLARMASPAQVAALVLSDVVGDALDVIASGPTVPDPTTFEDAAAVLSRYDLWPQVPPSVSDHIRRGLAGSVAETAKPGDPLFDRVSTTVVGSGAVTAEAALARAEGLGYRGFLLTTWLQGEAREAGRFLAAIGMELASADRPVATPACVVAGGETTVRLRHLGGDGGRNQELALSAALALDGWDRVTIAAMGTDGIDGTTAHAGAVVDGQSARRAREAGLNPEHALAQHDSGPLFAALGDAIVTGPTGTNVNDLALVLVDGAADAPTPDP